jgi:hypothetical protein
MSSKFVAAHAVVAMTGPTAPLLIRAKRLVGETFVGFTTPELSVLNLYVEGVTVERTVSLLMVFLSVGYTLFVIELRLAKMARIVSERFVSSLTRLASFAFCLRVLHIIRPWDLHHVHLSIMAIVVVLFAIL